MVTFNAEYESISLLERQRLADSARHCDLAL
jgi:hypothetical protein